MSIWRALALPFALTSLLFVSFSALLIGGTAVAGYESSIIRIIPSFLLLSWLFKYAYFMLDSAANGISETPVLSTDMLTPFETRPLVQLLLCIAVFVVSTQLGGLPGRAILVMYLILLPASIGVLGVTQEVTAAINPVTLLRTAWGLGPYYLLILVFITCYAYIFSLAQSIAMWEAARYAFLELAILSIFSLIGGAIFVRRNQLGFEPRASPERKAAAAEAERLKQRARTLDEMYGLVRAGESRRCAVPLTQWLSSLDREHLTLDVRAIVHQAAQWQNTRGLEVVTQCLVTHLIQIAEPDLALETLNTTLRQLPAYALDSYDHTLLIAQRAQASGERQLAHVIAANFVARSPASQTSTALQALLAESA